MLVLGLQEDQGSAWAGLQRIGRARVRAGAQLLSQHPHHVLVLAREERDVERPAREGAFLFWGECEAAFLLAWPTDCS